MNYFGVRQLLLVGLLAFLPTSPVFAQQLDGVLKKAIGVVAEGKCPPSLMSPLLVVECEKTMPKFGQNIKQRGSVTEVDYKGVQQTPMGPADAYMVKFSNGPNMLWLISVGSDDKLIVFWTGG